MGAVNRLGAAACVPDSAAFLQAALLKNSSALSRRIILI